MIDQDTKDRITKVKERQARSMAWKRLERDGHTSSRNIKRRLALIASERMLPAAEVGKAARWPNTVAFCAEHAISLDWVLYGDLKGLLRTAQDARMVSVERADANAAEVATLFKRLPAQDQIRMLHGLRRMTHPQSKEQR